MGKRYQVRRIRKKYEQGETVFAREFLRITIIRAVIRRSDFRRIKLQNTAFVFLSDRKYGLEYETITC